MNEFIEKLCDPFYPKKNSMLFFRYLQPKMIKIKSFFHGLGRHSLEEINEFSFEDLKAISILLGNKKFFNGDECSSEDCKMIYF